MHQSIYGNAVGVQVDGGTASLYRNTIEYNGTGVLVNGGTLTTITQNFLSNNTYDGVGLTGSSTVANIYDNDLSGNGLYGVDNLTDPTTISATYDWWGTYDYHVAVPAYVNNSSDVHFMPVLNDGTDTQPATPGFQGDLGSLDPTTTLTSAARPIDLRHQHHLHGHGDAAPARWPRAR